MVDHVGPDALGPARHALGRAGAQVGKGPDGDEATSGIPQVARQRRALPIAALSIAAMLTLAMPLAAS